MIASKMHKVFVISCIFAILALVGAQEEVDQNLPDKEVEETNHDNEDQDSNVGSEVALMDSGSSEDAPDSFIGEDGAVIRAKRYCGYGCCGCNCNCATMAPGVTYGPCGCCGCGYG